jgi:hypothetical protein
MASWAEAGLRRPQEGHVALRPFLSERYVAFTHTTVLLGTYYPVFSFKSISTDGNLPPWKNIQIAVRSAHAVLTVTNPSMNAVCRMLEPLCHPLQRVTDVANLA